MAFNTHEIMDFINDSTRRDISDGNRLIGKAKNLSEIDGGDYEELLATLLEDN